MCGIAGVVRFDGSRSDDRDVAAALRAALAHRGPDGAGEYRAPDGRALLVHRRLAIIDPSERAAQPMSTADGRWHLTFNGEIYNYQALRRIVEERGAALRTTSDTEVLLYLLALEGPGALARLRGMFALGLWDARAASLLLARDRFGMKPLYVARRDRSLAFASEITALTATGLASAEVSPAGVLAFLRWASIPAPLTWARDVEQLEPGTWQRVAGDGTLTCGRFADPRLPYVGEEAVSESDLRERTATAFRDTLRAHLVADVPVGIFLSSGIDSGALVSAARSQTNAALHTYTVIVDDGAYSEEPLARRVADQFGATHHTLRVDAHQIEHDLDSVVGCLDAPTADAVNSFYVSRAVAQTGVKAVLSGIGGDELFGGYPSFQRIPPAVAVGRVLGPIMRTTGAAAVLALPAWQAAKYQQFAIDPALMSAYRALRGLFMPGEIPGLAGPALLDEAQWARAQAAADAAERATFDAAGEESAVASVARMETRGFLGGQLLRDVDAVSMAHGLEVRMPFVDHELQQAVWPALGAHPQLIRGKRLLAEAVPAPLPAAVTTQRKRTFTLPFDVWMRGPLRGQVREGIDALAARRWITAEAGAATWRAWETGQAHWSRVWGLAILGRFLVTHS